MKKTDIAMLILIAAVSILISAVTLNAVLGNPSEKTRKVKVTDEISDSFTEPSKDIFNKDAINPTVTVHVGDGSSEGSDDKDNSSSDEESETDKNVDE